MMLVNHYAIWPPIPKTITGVAQGSITSLQIFNIFINALLRMFTVTGQNEDISHGLQIGKDQKGDSQRRR